MAKIDDKQYESIKDKLKKLHALAERGYKGEAENARLAIERICSQYGLKIEDVLDLNTKHKYTFEVGRKREFFNLFIRCLSMTCDITDMSYSQPTRSSIRVELTALEYAETLSLFNWHKGNYERELKEFQATFMSAYIGKHDLYFDKERGGEKSLDELTKEDIARIRRTLIMQTAMSNETYHKQIEA